MPTKKTGLSVFLLAVILAVIVPGEVWHDLLSGHHDTQDAFYSDAPRSLENAHHHCEVLKFQVPEYLSGPYLNFCADNRFYPFVPANYRNPEIHSFHRTIALRGPPAGLRFS